MRQLEREKEDIQIDLENFQNSLPDREQMIQDLIDSVEKSLEKFNTKS